MAFIAGFLMLQAEDSFAVQLWAGLGRNPVLLFPFIVFFVGYAIRRARQVKGGTVVTESAPPPILSPAECGMLLHEQLGSREVAATLVDLSVKKYLSIVDQKPAKAVDGSELMFRALRPEDKWQQLEPHEKTLMRAAFRDKTWVSSQMQQLVPEVVPAMEGEVKVSLWQKGMYRSDPSNPTVPRWKGLVYVFSLMGMLDALAGLQLGLGIHLYDSPILGLMMVAVAMAILVWALQDPTKLTTKGAQAITHLKGLRQFIAEVEADRLKRLERYRFDELVPYAIVFGIEGKWARAFQQLSVQPLEWFGDEQTDSVLRGGRLTVLSAYLPAAGPEKL